MEKVKTFAGYTEEEIKEISIDRKLDKKFETSLKDVSDSKLKTIADFDKKYQLQTKRSYWLKTGWFGYYNLIQKDGTNFSSRFKLYQISFTDQEVLKI